jgi:hypothetical protein
MSSATERYFQQQDRKRILDQNYANRPERKAKRAKRKLEEISKAWKTEIGCKEEVRGDIESVEDRNWGQC